MKLPAARIIDGRAQSTLRKVAAHDIREWALTGGLAIEIHHLRLGHGPRFRPLNDVDFIANSFDCIPHTLAHDFLFSHVHPLDPPGKMMLQFIDPQSALRCDVFRACGATMSRTSPLHLPDCTIQLISLEDLVARAARLALDLAGGVAVPSKHVSDFLRLIELIDTADVEIAWQDHRKPNHPATFEQSAGLLRSLIPASQNLLITPTYSRDTREVCGRCASTTSFHLADPGVILSLLGYC